MISFLVEDATGNRDWAIADLTGDREQLSWLRDWEGLDRMDVAVAAEADEDLENPPSSFLLRWIKDEQHGRESL
jgi:hypothetical protein